MLGNKPVIPTVPAVNWDRAVSFYRDTLGCKIQNTSVQGNAIVQCADSSHFLLYQRDSISCEHMALSFMVDNIENEVNELSQKNVKFIDYSSGPYTTTNHIATMGQAKMCWFYDSEGNILGVSQFATADMQLMGMTMAGTASRMNP